VSKEFDTQGRAGVYAAKELGKMAVDASPAGDVRNIYDGVRERDKTKTVLGVLGLASNLGGPVAKTAVKSGIWSVKKGFSAAGNALAHWNKHKSDFPEINNAKGYVEAAKKFTSSPPTTALARTRASNGDVVTYDPPSNTLAVTQADGTPKTMFKPGPASTSKPAGYDPSKYSSPLDYYLGSH
jgi:pyocin large subunit-like protein